MLPHKAPLVSCGCFVPHTTSGGLPYCRSSRRPGIKMRLAHLSPRRRNVCGLMLITAITVLWLLRRILHRPPHRHFSVAKLAELNNVPPPALVDKAIIMATRSWEDSEWVYDFKPEWTPYIYSASTPPEPGFKLVPSTFKGREAAVYLDFIIANYDGGLPYYMAFLHANKHQWHNEPLGPFQPAYLHSLRLDTVERLGFVNLRCAADPGCPLSLSPHDPSPADVRKGDVRARIAGYLVQIFGLDGPHQVPRAIGAPCCGQFVVTRARVRARRKADYERMRAWLWDAQGVTDVEAGWVFEMVWHMIFGMAPVHCPNYEQCRCDLHGWCGPLANGSVLQAQARPQADTPARPFGAGGGVPSLVGMVPRSNPAD